jgi:acyl-CoA thioester hydrolase
MLEVLRSSVNTWECDQMGHMNVRHYFARATQGFALLGMQLGLGPHELAARGLTLRAAEQHVRFHHELRPGVAFTLSAGILDASPERLTVYEELRSLSTDRVSATFVTDLRLSSAIPGEPVGFPAQSVDRAQAFVTPLPEHGAPRGLTLDPARQPPSRTDPLAQRMIGAFLGPVLPEDCDPHGFAAEPMFMARISDGIPHFFKRIRHGLRPDGVGGAALEYRYVYRERPRVGAVIEVRSALLGMDKKALRLGHGFFDVGTGRCLATSEAIVVSFDLTTRKSVEIPDDARAAMQPHVVSEFRA